MVSIVNTITTNGLDAIKTEVQVTTLPGQPCFSVVGMQGRAINEAEIRIQSAFAAMGISLPPKKIYVGLTPADIHKDGGHYDLPIAIALLCELKIIPEFDYTKYIILGELGMNASINSTPVALMAAIFASVNSFELICPYDNGPICTLAKCNNILAPKSLIQLINYFNNSEIIPKPSIPKLVTEEKFDHDFSQIAGQPLIKRGLEIAAAGGHSVILRGPPGCGKTFSVDCFRSILPRLTAKEIMEICMVRSLGNNLAGECLYIKRPFRSPHHSSSAISIIGGGKNVIPGEVTLANCGVLFLDELAEFSPALLDMLREPMESGVIHIARATRHVTYPASFQLIAAMNPCKCGYFGDSKRECSTAPLCAKNYQKKLSGPFLDRIDIFVDVAKQPENTPPKISEEKFENVRARVEHARKIQYHRYEGYKFSVNARADCDLEKIIQIDTNALELLNKSLEEKKISKRSYKKILRVARTIADLSAKPNVEKHDILEAMYFKVFNI